MPFAWSLVMAIIPVFILGIFYTKLGAEYQTLWLITCTSWTPQDISARIITDTVRL